jgi:hypothetical protein
MTKNANVDKCTFHQTLTIIDDYGNDKTILAFFYNFTRSIYKRANWDNLPSGNMLKIAPGFRFGPEFQTLLTEEHNRQLGHISKGCSRPGELAERA